MNLTEIFSLLASAERQQVLIELWESGRTTVDELSRRIAAEDDERSSNDVEYIEIQLVHNHLPRLEAYGVIEYDDGSGDVRLTATGEDLEPILEATMKSAVTIP